jgi:hypothetical protein
MMDSLLAKTTPSMSGLRMLMRSMDRCWCSSSSPPFLPLLFLSLSSSRVLPLLYEGYRERESIANEWMRERVRL